MITYFSRILNIAKKNYCDALWTSSYSAINKIFPSLFMDKSF